MTHHHVIAIEDPSSFTSSSDDTSSTTSSTESGASTALLPWKVLCLVLVLLVTLGWVCVIVLLILKEEWQLVMVSWLLLYAGGHFCYWYFKRHSRRGDPDATLVQRIVSRLNGVEGQSQTAEPIDPPPSYDELIKSELPPPAYHCVVKETPKLRRVLLTTLPWFLKKKALEGANQNSCMMSENHLDVSAGKPTTSSDTLDYQNDEAWKASGGGGPRVDSIVVADVPLTEMPLAVRHLQQIAALHHAPQQPVLTPIHEALAALPVVPGNSQRATSESP